MWKLILSVFLVLLIACGTRKKVSEASGSVVNVTKNTFFQKLDSSRTDFRTLLIKGKVTYETNGERNKFDYKIHVWRDSAVWVWAGLFGIEGGRILVTKDSVKYINKLERTYLVSDFSMAKELIGMEVNLTQLQDLLIGNVPKIALKPKINITADQTEIIYEQGDSKLAFFTDRQLLRLRQVLSNLHTTKAQLTHSSYKSVNDKNLPFVTKIAVENGKGSQTMTFEHADIQVNPVDLKLTFSIPADYEPMAK
jgi:hypothetical protein